jgi:hypothetical protein
MQRDKKKSKMLFKLSFTKYSTGDLVWCLHETRKVGVTPKLEKAYDGPLWLRLIFQILPLYFRSIKRGQKGLCTIISLSCIQGVCPPLWAHRLAKNLKSCLMITRFYQILCYCVTWIYDCVYILHYSRIKLFLFVLFCVFCKFRYVMKIIKMFWFVWKNSLG